MLALYTVEAVSRYANILKSGNNNHGCWSWWMCRLTRYFTPAEESQFWFSEEIRCMCHALRESYRSAFYILCVSNRVRLGMEGPYSTPLPLCAYDNNNINVFMRYILMCRDKIKVSVLSWQTHIGCRKKFEECCFGKVVAYSKEACSLKLLGGLWTFCVGKWKKSNDVQSDERRGTKKCNGKAPPKA